MKIDREPLLDEVWRETGLDDFGAPAFREGLDALIASVAVGQDIPESARPAVTTRLKEPLVQRLKLYADRARYPEIAQQRIERPLIVIGLPRSGTTFLHALLAQDPAARSPRSWQLGDPSPPPAAATIETDPRIAITDAAQAALPEAFKMMHMIGATLPEECNAITTLGFCSPNFGAGLRVPSYTEWFMAADARPAYQTHQHMLQHLQAFTAGESWVLKAPPHMFHMPELIETYPDARIVFPHRDPAATLPSLASLIAFIRGWIYPSVDRADVGREQAAMWAEAIDRVMAFRRDPAQSGRFVDVSYQTLIADPMVAVRSIYGHFEMDLSAEAEAAMERFLAEKPKDKHGSHRYSLEEAGLTREGIHERFKDYLEEYVLQRA